MLALGPRGYGLGMLSVALFGSMSASLGASSSARMLTLAPRVAELLAFLALGRGQYFSRADLADSLWGDRGREVGRGVIEQQFGIGGTVYIACTVLGYCL